MTDHYKPVVLCVLDGWGIDDSKSNKYNAIGQARTPCWDFLLKNFPNSRLLTSGSAVGLPDGQMGNSEVGHMTIGSGRIILQDLLRINKSISDGSLAQHSYLQALVKDYKNSDHAVHLFGLCSDGGVHSHIDHLIFLIEFLNQNNIKVKLHLFLDGRDVAPNSSGIFLKKIQDVVKQSKNVQIASIAGRFYAMDRDNKWDRTELSYKAIVEAKADKITNIEDYIAGQYDKGIFDEFIPPVIIDDYQGIKDNDSVIFSNFRSDRIRQLAKSILFSKFDHFKKKNIKLKHKLGMTHYSKELNKYLKVLFPEQNLENNLGQIVSVSGKKQLRIAETEKYAHVTFFFNGGVEEAYSGEDRVLVPSPNVRTYDLQPEMSSYLLTEELIKAIESKKYDLIIINYASGDMVGHSGNMEAAIKAAEVIDDCLSKIYKVIKATNSMLMITADHGNLEHMFDEKNQLPHTSHTTNPVPFVVVANNLCKTKKSLPEGNLSDVAPTVLDVLGLETPQEMTGKSLVKNIKIKKESFFDNCMSIFLALLIALLIRTIIFEPYSIPSGSMKPNFLVGDYLFVSKYRYGFSNTSILFEPDLIEDRILDIHKPQRGDVVVFKPDHSYYSNMLDRLLGVNYIKRLIGLPGDKVQVKEGVVYINGERIERKEDGVFVDTDGSVLKKYVETLPDGKSYAVLEESDDNAWDNTGVYVVPEGHYFFMGDNRDHSIDSRFLKGPIGFVPYDKIIGKAEIVIFSNPRSILDIFRFPFAFNKDRFFVLVN